MSALPQRRHLPALTGLRFLAALAVVGVHLRGHVSALLPGAGAVDPVLAAGVVGVDLFFVLSGFVIGYHYADELARPGVRSYLRYLRQRLARIYPLHLAATAGLLLLVLLARLGGRGTPAEGDYSVGELVANLLLVHCWTLRECVPTWNPVAWSLSAEWLAYLLFPLAAALAAWPTRRRGLLAVIAAVVAIQLTLTEVLGFGGGIARVAGTFTLGVLLARLHHDGLPKLDWTAVTAWTAATATVTGVGLSVAGHSPTAMVPLFGLLVLALANAGDGRLARALSRPGMRYWGEASYALYLTHAVLLALLALLVRLELFTGQPLAVRAGLLVGYLTAMLVLAAVAHELVEEPLRRRLRAPSQVRPVPADGAQEGTGVVAERLAGRERTGTGRTLGEQPLGDADGDGGRHPVHVAHAAPGGGDAGGTADLGEDRGASAPALLG